MEIIQRVVEVEAVVVDLEEVLPQVLLGLLLQVLMAEQAELEETVTLAVVVAAAVEHDTILVMDELAVLVERGTEEPIVEEDEPDDTLEPIDEMDELVVQVHEHHHEQLVVLADMGIPMEVMAVHHEYDPLVAQEAIVFTELAVMAVLYRAQRADQTILLEELAEALVLVLVVTVVTVEDLPLLL